MGGTCTTESGGCQIGTHCKSLILHRNWRFWAALGAIFLGSTWGDVSSGHKSGIQANAALPGVKYGHIPEGITLNKSCDPLASFEIFLETWKSIIEYPDLQYLVYLHRYSVISYQTR